jgi:hypothetical protein
MPTVDDLTQVLESLRPWLPYIASFASGLYTTIVFIVNSRRSARKEALDSANAHIALQDVSFEGLSKKYDALLKRFDDEHRVWMEERDEMRSTIGELEVKVRDLLSRNATALRHIRNLRSLMQECGIPVPPLPEQLQVETW